MREQRRRGRAFRGREGRRTDGQGQIGRSIGVAAGQGGQGELAEYVRVLDRMRVNAEASAFQQTRHIPVPQGRYVGALILGSFPMPTRVLVRAEIQVAVMSRRQAEELGMEIRSEMAGRPVELPSGRTDYSRGTVKTEVKVRLEDAWEIPVVFHVVEEEITPMVGRVVMAMLRLQDEGGRLVDGARRAVGVRDRNSA